VKPIRFQRNARREYDKAIARYENERPGLGLDFQEEVKAAIARIRKNPQLGSRFLDTEYRYYVVHRFPYVIYYEDAEGYLGIMAVAHSARRPRYWSRRKWD